MPQKYDFHIPHLRYMAAIGQFFDELTAFLIMRTFLPTIFSIWRIAACHSEEIAPVDVLLQLLLDYLAILFDGFSK